MLVKLKRKIHSPFLIFGLLLSLQIYFPELLIALLILSLIGIILHGLVPLLYLRRRSINRTKPRTAHTPKVSVHIPCSNEPPALVIQTIKCCLKSDYPNLEIIVLDNNTRSPKKWKPIEKFCRENSVSFKHYDKLPGYKAGALNEALKITPQDSKYIFVCDADYCLEKDGISRAVAIAESEDVSLVQFPQAYRNVDKGNLDLNEEFFHYFQVYSNGSDFSGNSLATGTLTLLNKQDLESLKGWSSRSITEDASLGVAFRDRGLKTKYVHEKIGYGLMPESSAELRKQRTRWMFGNTQTAQEVMRSRMPLKDKLECLFQLTAWINFLGLPFLALISYTLLNMFSTPYDHPLIAPLILSCFSAYLLLKFVVFSISAKRPKAFLVHLSFIWEGAFCWWDALLGRKIPFYRTCKEKTEEDRTLGNLLPAFSLALLAIISFWSAQWYLSILAFAYAILFLRASFTLTEQLFETKHLHLKSISS